MAQNSKFRLEGDIQIMGPGFGERSQETITAALTFTRHDGEIGLIQRQMTATEWAAMTAASRQHVFVTLFAGGYAAEGRLSDFDKNFLRQVILRWADQVDWATTPTRQFYQLDHFVETRL